MSGVNYSGTTVIASPGASGAIVIRPGTTEISGYAFNRNINITSITFNTDGALTRIGDLAFNGCTKLIGPLTIPDGVTIIGECAFQQCIRISGPLIIPASVTSIGLGAFNRCDILTGILNIPNSVTSIGRMAFTGCPFLTGPVNIPEGVTMIGDMTFSGCSRLTGPLTIPNSVTMIGISAFKGCSSLTGALTIPGSVTTIETEAFQGCYGLNGNLTIANGVTSFGDYAFSDCSGLTGSLTIPNSVTAMGGSVFRGCSGFKGNLTISNSITVLNHQSFHNCSGLTGNLVIPSSVTTIYNDVFTGCVGITGMRILGDGTNLTTMGPNLLDVNTRIKYVLVLPGWNGLATFGEGGIPITTCGVNYSGNIVDASPDASGDISLWDGTTEITMTAFQNNTKITSITFNTDGALTNIGIAAFASCSGLRGTLTIPDSVTTIDYGAFSGCATLNNVIISDSVTTIEDIVFKDCTNLSKVRILGDGTLLTSLGSDLLLGTGVTYVSAPFGWRGPTMFGGIPIIPDSPPILLPPNATAGASSLSSAAQAIVEDGPLNFFTSEGVAAAVVAAVGKSSIYQQLPAGLNAVLSGQAAKDFISVYKVNNSNSVLITPVTIATPTTDGVISTPPASGSFFLAVSSAVNATYRYANSLDTLVVSGGVQTFVPGYAQSGPVVLAVKKPYIHKYTGLTPGSIITTILVVGALGSLVTGPSDVNYNVENNVITVIASPDASGDIVLLDGTTDISDNAFQGNTNITSITFSGALTTIGAAAFADCSNLTSVRILGDGSQLTSMGANLLANTQVTFVSAPYDWIGPSTFGGVPVVPDSPTISFSDASDSSVVVSWEQPPGATSYDLDVSGSQMISDASSGMTVTGLYYSTLYTFTLTIRYSDDSTKTVTATYTTGPCFLADAPVLTPTGYRPIASLRVGDLVQTATGKALPIVSIKKIRALPNPESLPYLIPSDLYGATQDLPISPHHLVRQPGKEARHLGLAHHPMTEPWDYYNLELTDHEADMVVAGVVVETWKPWDGVERDA